MAGTSTIGGLIPGLDTATIVDQLISISRRRIDLVVNNQTAHTEKKSAYQSLNTNLSNFKSKADILRNIDAFKVFKNAITTDSTNFNASDLLSVSSTTDASPSTHTIEFTSSSQLAQARQLSSRSYTDSTTALGISGEFVINGKAISISTTDTLADIAVSIDNANSGTNATGVTASVLSISSSDNRLILTSDNTGEDKFTILDASSGDIVQSLGFTNSSTAIKNSTGDGAKSDEFSNSGSAVGSLLGLSSAQSGTVTIGGAGVAIDLATESITTIASNIDAVAGVSASVISTTTDGVTTYQIDISGTTSFTDSNNILETLGILEGQQSFVAEVQTASRAYTEVGGGNPAITSATTFDKINTGDDKNKVKNFETITLSGTDHYGGSVLGTYTIIDKATDTIQGLLTQIESVFGLTAGSVTINSSGQIVITDSTTGPSQLNVNIIENNEVDGLLDFGIVTVTIEGSNGSVNEVHAGSVANTTDGSTPITDSNTFDQIFGAGVGTTDTITIQGTEKDGTAINTTSYAIHNGSSYKAVSDLLTTIENLYGGTTYVDAYISDGTDGNTAGQIVIKDMIAGESEISLTLITNNEGGGTLNLGTISAATQGYAMQMSAGQDAKVEIDGVGVTRSSNSIDDVINGVTIDLARVESGTTVNLTISRDTDSIKSSVNDFITEYNGIIEFINQQFTFDEDTESSGVLSGESTLRTIKSTIQSTITSINSLLPANYDALSLIGITSDINGKLSLDDNDFLSAINTDFNAVSRLFIAEGTTTNSEITYISHNNETVAGDYAVVINTVATQATVTGTTDLSGGIGAGNTETITITDTLTNRMATISLDGDVGENGSSIDNIVNAINSELATESTETLVGSVQNTESASAITSSTLLKDFDTGGGSLATNDVILISGTTRSGTSIGNSFTITDLDTTTVQNFLSFIEDTYNNKLTATINSSGEIVLTEDTVGDSQLSIDITEPGTLDFGTVSTTVEGRYAMEITASKNGSDQLVITHDSYGSNYGFLITEANDYSGITDGTYTGVDVVGTINGEAATGTGQILKGDSGSATSVEGLSIKVTSTTTGSKGNVKLTIGVAEELYRKLDYFTDQFDGLVTVKMDGLEDTIEDLQDTIDDMEARLVMERIRLENQFVQLELSLSRLQTVSSFLSQQLGSLANLLS